MKRKQPSLSGATGYVHLERLTFPVPDHAREIERWMPLLAAARLNENIIPERETLIQMVKEGVAT